MLLPILTAFLMGASPNTHIARMSLPAMSYRFNSSAFTKSPVFPSSRAHETNEADVTIRVDTKAPGIPVSRYLYGIFFEEINHAGDGGLYAEMVQNRSFEEGNGGMNGWTVNASDKGKVEAQQDSSLPLNPNNPHALRLNITANPGEVTVSNTGYWGMAFRKGQSYTFSLYERAAAHFSGSLEVRLQDKDGKVVGRKALAAPSGDWKKIDVTLKAGEDVSGGNLVLATRGTGTVYLDMVSLFPKETFQNRDNGMRKDLAQTVAAIRPGFMRFPGGCFVEGDTMASAFRWKNTMGDVAQRPPRACLWGYQSTEGLGYHEYLQFCEDVGAAALLVVNCGMSHHGSIPMNEMGQWVQDALDALEYANGPTTTKWGALRAKNGHPKPFGLKFIEVGNENGGPDYEARFPLFAAAIRKYYPDLKIIADVWGGTPRTRTFDLIDEHYYNNPDFFFENATRYDGYSRSGPKVYVGEYAVTEGSGTGNLHAALGEAAFMVGMERNADVVQMASYAPLFVRSENRAWNPDAIVFNSAQVYGTPSYQVQRLFSNNLPQVSLPTTLLFSPQAIAAISNRPPSNGAVGLGTWNTQAEFKEITVTGSDGTSLPISAERIVQGTWQHNSDSIAQSEDGDDKRIILGDPQWTDYTYSVKARKIAGAEGFLIPFRVRDDKNLYWWNLGGWGNTRHAVERMVNGGKTVVGQDVPGSIETGRWYSIRIEVRGPQVRCYLDDKLMSSFEEGIRLFHATAGRTKDEYMVKVVNGSETALTTNIALPGWNGAGDTVMARITTLTGDNLEAENSFDHPEQIAPKTETALLPVVQTADAPALRYTFPPRSVTVLYFR